MIQLKCTVSCDASFRPPNVPIEGHDPPVARRIARNLFHPTIDRSAIGETSVQLQYLVQLEVERTSHRRGAVRFLNHHVPASLIGGVQRIDTFGRWNRRSWNPRICGHRPSSPYRYIGQLALFSLSHNAHPGRSDRPSASSQCSCNFWDRYNCRLSFRATTASFDDDSLDVFVVPRRFDERFCIFETVGHHGDVVFE